MKREVKKNILEILKTCPIGTELYTPLCGKVTLHNIFDNSIEVKNDNNDTIIFNEDGSARGFFNGYAKSGECLLFPSEYNKNWREFTTNSSFMPFDKVIGNNDHEWHIDFFERYDLKDNFPYICMTDSYKKCLPYNEETAKLIGTWNDED